MAHIWDGAVMSVLGDDAVATFLERTATFMAADGERRRADAAAIRRGLMPGSFQRAMSREAATP